MKNAEILVVEDENITAMSIKHKLHCLGYKVTSIESSGKEAIKRAEELKPDIILMDIALKGEIDGIETAAQIHDTLDIPIIYLTAYFDDMILERAKLTDPAGYIIKPFSDGELKSAIEIALYKHSLKKDIISPNRDLESLNLADIIDISAIQSLLEDFYKLTHIPVGIVDLKGNVLVGVGWQDICTKFHRVHPETSKNCMESDIHLSKDVSLGEFKLYRCKNNMWDIVTPIMINNQTLGNIFLGQFLFDNEEPDYNFFRKQGRKYGFNEEEYINALKSVPRLSKKTVNESMAFFMKLANIISLLSYSNIKLAMSLTERNTLMNSLQESEKYQKTILSTVQTGIIVIDAETKKIIDINEAALELIGTQRDKIVGNICHNFMCPANEKQCPILDLNQRVDNSERILLNINNEEIPIIKTVVSITLNGRECLLESFIDITELRSTENKIKASLKEKELLLHEIHHRVKNNLQIISSLLSLQSRYIEDNKALNALKESQNRVKSLAMIHEKLYKSSSLVKINFAEYVKDLTDSIFYTYKINPYAIKLNIDIDNVFLDIETAIPCGLIINELVTNCLKHAFSSAYIRGAANKEFIRPTAYGIVPPANTAKQTSNEFNDSNAEKNEIRIKLIRINDNFVLSINDNGIGLPDDFNYKNSDSLGLQLVNNLVNQLEGTINVDGTEGTNFKIIFKELKYKERI